LDIAMRRFRHILPLILLCLPMGLSLPAAEEAAEPRSPAAQSDGKAGEQAPPAAPEDTVRFTNADLPPLRREDMGAGGDEAAAIAGDGTEKQKEEAGGTLGEALAGAKEEALKTSLDETRKEIAMLELRLDHLNSRLLSVRNPLLKRVTPPSREEEEAVGGAANTERLSWVKEQIAAAEEAQVEAQARFQTLLRR
jgi:hypothetical protein